MKVVIGIIIGLLIAVGAWFVFIEFKPGSAPEPTPEPVVTETEITEPEVTEPEVTEPDPNVFGQSVEGRDLYFERFGTGEKNVLLVGGIHGGYEWNSVVLAQDFVEYFTAHPETIPEDITLTVVPLLNPDGLHKVGVIPGDLNFDEMDLIANTSSGRFNANNVDLNRNFDCNWQSTATWQDKEVSAGTAAFSEPEAAAFRDFVTELQPEITLFWHSASNGTYTSFCNGEALPDTVAYGKIYSEASDYAWHDDYEYYEVTGDVADWMSTIGLPAFTAELETHETIEWDRNLAGVFALLNAVSEFETQPAPEFATPDEMEVSSADMEVTDFESCAEVTGVVALSYPAKCTYDGVTYTEEVDAAVSL